MKLLSLPINRRLTAWTLCIRAGFRDVGEAETFWLQCKINPVSMKTQTKQKANTFNKLSLLVPTLKKRTYTTKRLEYDINKTVNMKIC